MFLLRLLKVQYKITLITLIVVRNLSKCSKIWLEYMPDRTGLFLFSTVSSRLVFGF